MLVNSTSTISGLARRDRISSSSQPRGVNPYKCPMKEIYKTRYSYCS